MFIALLFLLFDCARCFLSLTINSELFYSFVCFEITNTFSIVDVCFLRDHLRIESINCHFAYWSPYCRTFLIFFYHPFLHKNIGTFLYGTGRVSFLLLRCNHVFYNTLFWIKHLLFLSLSLSLSLSHKQHIFSLKIHYMVTKVALVSNI